MNSSQKIRHAEPELVHKVAWFQKIRHAEFISASAIALPYRFRVKLGMTLTFHLQMLCRFFFKKCMSCWTWFIICLFIDSGSSPEWRNFSFANVMRNFFQKIKVMLNSNLFTRSLGFSIYFIRRFRVKLGMTQFFYKFGTTQFFTDFEPVFGTLFSESRENTRTRKPRW